MPFIAVATVTKTDKTQADTDSKQSAESSEESSQTDSNNVSQITVSGGPSTVVICNGHQGEPPKDSNMNTSGDGLPTETMEQGQGQETETGGATTQDNSATPNTAKERDSRGVRRSGSCNEIDNVEAANAEESMVTDQRGEGEGESNSMERQGMIYCGDL